jgi:hypothetical protein
LIFEEGVTQMKIESFQSYQKEKVISLLKPNKDEQDEKNRLWDWQYTENPLAKGSNLGLVIYEESDVIGFNGIQSVILKYNNNEIKGAWSFDTVFSPKCRGKGYGVKLFEIVRNSAPVVIGLGISDGGAKIAFKNGFKISVDVEQFHYVKRPRHLKEFLKMIIQFSSNIKSLVKKSEKTKLKYTLLDASDISKDIDVLWKKVEEGYTKIVKKNHSYIKWKYGSHPLKKYQCIVINNDKEIVGIGIFRSDEEMSRLIDYIGPSSSIPIKRLIIEVFKKQCTRAHLLECTCSDEEFKKLLAASGFRKYKVSPRFMIYSNIANDKDPEKNWFVMGGDSDNDL